MSKAIGEGHEGAVAAINEALGLAGDEAHTEEEIDEEGADAAGEGEDGDGDVEGDAEGGEEGDDKGDTRSEEEKLAATKQAVTDKAAAKGDRNPDGTFKKGDPINDPIPKDLKKETSDRMQSLIKIAKDVTADRDQYRTNFDTIINGIKASGASPEQYGEAISWLQLFNNPAPESRMKAYELINDVAERMAMLLGVDRQAADPLANHPDLKAAVAANQVTPTIARELARTRSAKVFTGQIQDGVTRQQQTEVQAQQELTQARAGINAFQQEMIASDPLYQRKIEQILPGLKASFKHVPRSQWVATLKEAYTAVKIAPRGRVNTNVQQPLRGGKNPAGGQAHQPLSALEAMNGALSSMK